VIGRPVVDDHDLDVLVGLRQRGVERGRDVALDVVRRDENRDQRPFFTGKQAA
jgi:hypothetical protein